MTSSEKSIVVPFVDLKAQYEAIKTDVNVAIESVCSQAAFIGGTYVKQFEADFAAFSGARSVIGVGNGTEALTIALRAMDLEPGFEAVVPANTFIATSEAVASAGGKPVFCDVDPLSYLLDLGSAEQVLTDKTRVIIPVHLFGQMVDMQAVRDFADSHGLFVLEDAAQAHGASRAGHRVGELSHFTAYSFYPSKNLGAYGDAGAITVVDPDLERKVRMAANHGRSDKYDHRFEGVNSRLDGLQAAVLSVKLRHLREWTAKRQAAASYYRQCLSGANLILPAAAEQGSHVYHLFVVQIDDRDKVRSDLSAAGISSGVHYPIALPFLAAYSDRDFAVTDFPVAYELSQRILSLPIFPEVSEEQIKHVADTLGRLTRANI